MRVIRILGSTGSIGKQVLKVVSASLQGQVRVSGLAAYGQKAALLAQQACTIFPDVVCVYDKGAAEFVRQRVASHIPVVEGLAGLESFVVEGEYDCLLVATSSALALPLTLKAIAAGKDIALASKEVMVAAGPLVLEMAHKHGVQVIPVDSEHTALLQCMQGNQPKDVEKVILTASGGPFWERTLGALDQVGVQEALKHPNYEMGPKVLVDSSTFMNKGLEVIEAHFFCGLPPKKIDVVVHPQQIVHALVEFVDHTLLAQISDPDMFFPIQTALTYPERVPNNYPSFSFSEVSRWEFFPPDHSRFPCLRIAYEVLSVGGSLPCFMNAANEVLVSRFLQGSLPWKGIGRSLEKLVEKHNVIYSFDVDTLMEVDKEARQLAKLI